MIYQVHYKVALKKTTFEEIPEKYLFSFLWIQAQINILVSFHNFFLIAEQLQNLLFCKLAAASDKLIIFCYKIFKNFISKRFFEIYGHDASEIL